MPAFVGMTGGYRTPIYVALYLAGLLISFLPLGFFGHSPFKFSCAWFGLSLCMFFSRTFYFAFTVSASIAYH